MSYQYKVTITFSDMTQSNSESKSVCKRYYFRVSGTFESTDIQSAEDHVYNNVMDIDLCEITNLEVEEVGN